MVIVLKSNLPFNNMAIIVRIAVVEDSCQSDMLLQKDDKQLQMTRNDKSKTINADRRHLPERLLASRPLSVSL